MFAFSKESKNKGESAPCSLLSKVTLYDSGDIRTELTSFMLRVEVFVQIMSTNIKKLGDTRLDEFHYFDDNGQSRKISYPKFARSIKF